MRKKIKIEIYKTLALTLNFPNLKSISKERLLFLLQFFYEKIAAMSISIE